MREETRVRCLEGVESQPPTPRRQRGEPPVPQRRGEPVPRHRGGEPAPQHRRGWEGVVEGERGRPEV